MPDVVIENPIINSPFVEPTRHFRFDDDGITDQIDDGRRPSSYFVPIAQAEEEKDLLNRCSPAIGREIALNRMISSMKFAAACRSGGRAAMLG